MKDLDAWNFGALIAFLLPGFALLIGLSWSSPDVKTWLDLTSADKAATVGGFLYSTLASLAIGLVLSALRWALLEPVYRLKFLKMPKLNVDFGKLRDEHTNTAFLGLNERHYKYHQYYGNMLIAVLMLVGVRLFSSQPFKCWHLILYIGVPTILFFGARDAMKKYVERVNTLIPKT